VHLTFHKSRHFYARLLLNKYHFSLEVVARCLGHSTTTQTRHYATLFNSTVFDAFEHISR
jgi:integrase